MKITVILALSLLLACSAASGQTFKRHKLGETAQEFFSIATMAESGGRSARYCKDYLSNPKVLSAYEKAQRNIFDTNAIIRSADVKGCKAVFEALDGKETEVGARYAAEIGKGGVTFRDSKLVSIVFNLSEGTVLEDVVTDISAELGGARPTMSLDTKQNGFGATLQERKATWDVNKMMAVASEMRDFQYGDMGIVVIVADSEYFKKKEAERQANRPNTIH
jgi:hypothetical protein